MTKRTNDSITVLSIDPGTKCMGWALWMGNERLVKRGIHRVPMARGLRRRDKKWDWLRRVDVMAAFVSAEVAACGVDVVVIEMPATYGGRKGTAAGKSGAVMKLAWCVATIRARCGCDVILAPVRVWKGTVPKRITQARVQRRYGVTGDHNMIDAIGIGDWYWRKGGKTNGR
jgi:hypothetical protein